MTFLTGADASRLLTELHDPLTPAGVRRASDTGHLPAIRTLGGIRLYRRRDIEAFAAGRKARHRSQRTDATSAAGRQ
jgi:hypothetical protein